VGGLLLLVAVLLGGLQTERGATAAARWLAATANPLPGTELTVGRASGTWLGALRLTNVSLARVDAAPDASAPLVHVDTLAARYRLWPLLRGHVHITDLDVADPAVTARQAADSSWDWARVLPTAPREQPPDTSAGLSLQIDRVRVARGTATARFYAGGRDSTARVEGLALRARDIATTPALTVRLDTLGLRAQLPGRAPDLTLTTQGALTPSALTLDTLRLDSPRSRVRGGGTVRLPRGAGGTVEDVALRVRARPFALADLTPFVPGLDVDPKESVRLALRVGGTGQQLTARADAQFSGGGTVAVRGTATPAVEAAPDGPPLQYRLDATVRRLTTSLLGPPDSTQQRLNATLRADLDGPSLDALSGPVDLRLHDTRWAPVRTDSLALAASLRDGLATLTLDGTLNDAPVRVSGTARPLADAPEATLTARVQRFDLATVVPDAGLQSALSARSTLRAQALGTDAQTLALDLELAPSRVGRQPLTGGTVTLDVQPARARLDARIALPEGAVRAAGTVALDGSERFALDRLRLDRVNPAALIGDTTAARLSGTVTASGRGFAPGAMRLDATVALQDSRYGPYRLSSLRTTARLADARLTSTTRATLNGGRWRLRLAGTPFAAAPAFSLTEGEFENVDIGPFLQDTTQTSRLRGTIGGRVAGLTPATMTVDAGLTLDSSRVNQQPLSSGRLDLRLADGTATTTLSLDTPDGGVALRGEARPFDPTPTFRVEEGTFERVDLGALAGMPGLTTALSGSLTLEGRGGTAETLALDAGLSFAESRINDAVLSSGRLRVAATKGRAQANGALAVDGGRIALDGTIDSLDATPAYAVETTVDSLDVGALAGLDSLSARVDTLRWTLDGRGTDPQTLTTQTHLSASGVQVDRLTFSDVALSGRLRRGQLVLDTLGVQSNVFEGRGEGILAVTDTAAASDFSLRATVTDPSPLRSLVGARTLRLQSGTFETRIYGTSLATQRFDGAAEVQGLLYDDVRLAEAEIAFNGQRGRTQLFQRLEVEGNIGYASLPSISVDQTDFDAAYDGTATALTAALRLDATHRASLDAQVRTDAAGTTVALRRLNLRLDGDKWSLLQEAVITAGAQYRIQGLLLHSGPQQVAVDGIVDPQGTQSLVATVESVRLGSVSSLAGLSGLDGTLSGSLTLDGPATAPRIDSRLSMDLRSEEREVGTLRLDADYEALALRLDARLTHANGSVLTATGRVPADLRLDAPSPANVEAQPVTLDLSTEQFPVNWVDPFLDPASVRDVTGTLSADVRVRGTLADPDLGGTAALSNGGAALPPLDTEYRDAAATLQFDDDRLTLTSAVLRSSNDGRLRAQGVINFPALTVGEFDLRLNASNFIAIDTRAYRRAIIDGALTLQGTTRRPTLDGTVKLRSANIYYNEALAETETAATAVPLTEEDQLTLENRFGLRLSAADTTTFDAYEALAMDLTVQIRRNTWLRSESNPELDIQFMGDLDLSKAPAEDPEIFGSIEVVTERSTLRQFGQEFQITEGTLTFNGDPYTPYLSLAAVYEQRARGSQGTEVRIVLGLEGRPDALTPTLSSEPPMDTRNILSYLATGRPADELLSGSGQGRGNLATQMALGQASNFVENLAASELGLDVVRVELRTSGASYLTVGRYFTPRFFVSLQQPVATSNLGSLQTSQYLPDLTLEYQLTDTLLMRMLNNQQSFQLNLLFEYAY
jgi:translocation and assembly module TamB